MPPLDPMTASPADLLSALRFAAERHRDQRRKGASAAPYVNHLVEVAETLARVGGVTDRATLVAAVLHDVVEDTATTADEVGTRFGADVQALVEAVTDDKALDKAERKQRQIDRAAGLPDAAKRIKLADKAANVREIAADPPPDWPLDRRVAYLNWAEAVVAGLRDADAALAAHFDAALAEARTGALARLASS